MRKITLELIENFKRHLIYEEKSKATLEKYIRDISAFYMWATDKELEKTLVLEYKQYLVNNYAPASVNSMLSSINSFFEYNEWYELRVRSLKIQKRIFADKDKELSKAEYDRLLKAAKRKNNEQLYLLMQTICSTGIRVSELQAVTVSAVKARQATINCKGKMRVIILPNDLCKMLMRYIKKCKISSGPVFVTRTGKPLNRSNM